MSEDASTLEEVYEPFLIQEGFIMRTSRGRVATVKAYKRFGYEPPTDGRAGTDGGVGNEREAGGGQSSLFE
jgi:Holliday junction DNA helicase RuvB